MRLFFHDQYNFEFFTGKFLDIVETSYTLFASKEVYLYKGVFERIYISGFLITYGANAVIYDM